MTRLKRHIILTIAIVLNYSISYAQSDSILSTGVVEQASVDTACIPVELIKIANSKMLELKYEKEINKNLRECVQVDSILIGVLRSNMAANELTHKEEINEVKRQRNIGYTGCGIFFLLLMISIL